MTVANLWVQEQPRQLIASAKRFRQGSPGNGEGPSPSARPGRPPLSDGARRPPAKRPSLDLVVSPGYGPPGSLSPSTSLQADMSPAVRSCRLLRGSHPLADRATGLLPCRSRGYCLLGPACGANRRSRR